MRGIVVAVLAAASACACATDPCRDAVFADPEVRRMLREQAGSPYLFDTYQDRLRQTEAQAALRCRQARGEIPSGGVAPVLAGQD